ncbi:MAG: hypothetical protein UR54_C0024G0002 [Candidatus Roizmanbacteria bacterium GW2011_GWA2_34_18]|uniref:Uncharacterized protein n=1 Tax=Candidatus Roizmanbacteria bacterium GW2011_GWA2_34_18 TaxID=1618477 RepID=A0A0G0B7N7_9BACT|nr:MAG: hypothetical protein UR54_C0024G0002 [Candidatus Roizmanbacteria bacterium GW2011_GWA2_34_18]
MPGAPVPDVQVVRPQEVIGALTKERAKINFAMPQDELDQIHAVQKARGQEGSLGAFTALESARLAAETGDKQWEGARGEDIKKLFTGPHGDKVAALVEQANDVQRALEIIGLDPAQQDVRLQEMKDAQLIDDTKYFDANALIESVCNQMAANKTFDVCFPMLNASRMTVKEKAIWFREALPQVPSVRKAISEAMAKWQESVFKFTDVPQTERTVLENQKSEKVTKASNTKTALNTFITTGLKIDTATIDPMQQAALELAMAKGDVIAVRQVLLRADNFNSQEIVEIKTYEQKLTELARNRELKKNPPANANKAFIDKEITRLIGETQTSPAKYARYQEINEYTNDEVFKLNLTEYKSQTKEANDLAIKISTLPTNQNEIKLQIQREREERAALDSLKVDAFISKAIIAGYDEAEASYALAKQSGDAQRLKEAEQAGRMDEAVMYTNKTKRWIEAKGDGHPEKVQLKNIRTDLITLKKDNKDDAAIKYFIARDAGLFDKELKFKIGPDDKTGEDIAVLIEAGTISARQALAYLDTSRYQRLTNLISTTSEDGSTSDKGTIGDYRETLIMDYNRALRYINQGRVGRAIRYGKGEKQLQLVDEKTQAENFELTSMEWKDIVTQLGPTNIEAAYKKDENIMKFINKLKEKGYASNPGVWLSLLMMIGFLKRE